MPSASKRRNSRQNVDGTTPPPHSNVPLHSIEYPIYIQTNPFTVFSFLLISLTSYYINQPSIASSIFITCLSIHLYCRFILGGWTKKQIVPSEQDIFVDLDLTPRNDTDLTKGSPLKVVVTGGGGFLGWTIVKHLQQDDSNIDIVAVDLFPPHSTRVVSGVNYIVADLCKDDLSQAMSEAHAVIHTAGVVNLTADVAVTFNAHVVGTARVIAAARKAGVRFIVQTSSVGSVTSPHITNRSQANLPIDFIPPEMNKETGLGFPFFSSYSSTKFRSERMTLAANSPPERFRTLAVRLPMIYGLQDPM